jgi:hypothetical protein
VGIIAAVRCVFALGVLILATIAARAAYATPTSRLVYSRSVDAESCPDEQALRRAVAARVGYDPFFAWATRTIVASITRRDRAFVATVDLIDESGVSHGARELRGEGECVELFDAVALAIAIAIDPQSLSRPAAPPTPPPSEPDAAAPAPVVAPAADPVDATPVRPALAAPSDVRLDSMAFEASVGAVASGGVAPAPAAGLALGAALRWPVVSLGLEGRIDAPAGGSALRGGDVTSWLVLGAFVPCAHLGAFFGCAVMQVGSAQTSGSGVQGARSESLPWWATGGRLGVLFRVSDDTLLRVRTDVVANLDRMTLQLNGVEAWPAPAVAASLGVDLVWHFR